jgi:hypothetical protein
MKMFKFIKLEAVEGKEQCRVDISNGFAALENFNEDLGIYVA